MIWFLYRYEKPIITSLILYYAVIMTPISKYAKIKISMLLLIRTGICKPIISQSIIFIIHITITAAPVRFVVPSILHRNELQQYPCTDV